MALEWAQGMARRLLHELGFVLQYLLVLALSLGSLLILSGPLGLGLVYAVLRGRPFRPFWVGGGRGLGYTLATVLSLLMALGLLFSLVFAYALLYAGYLLLTGTPLAGLEGDLLRGLAWVQAPLGTGLLGFLFGFPPTLFLAALGVAYHRGQGLPEALRLLARTELLPYGVLFLILVAFPILWQSLFPQTYREGLALAWSLAYGAWYWVHLLRGLGREGA